MFVVALGLLVGALQIAGAPGYHEGKHFKHDFTDVKSFKFHDHDAFRTSRWSRNPQLRSPSSYLNRRFRGSWRPSYASLKVHRYPGSRSEDLEYHVIPSRWVSDAGDSSFHVRIPSPIFGSDSTRSKPQTLDLQRARLADVFGNIPILNSTHMVIGNGTEGSSPSSDDADESLKSNSVALLAEDEQSTKDYGGNVSVTATVVGVREEKSENSTDEKLEDDALEGKRSEHKDIDKVNTGMDVRNSATGVTMETSGISTVSRENNGSSTITDKIIENNVQEINTSEIIGVDKVTVETSDLRPTVVTKEDEKTATFRSATSEMVTDEITAVEDITGETATEEKVPLQTVTDLPSDGTSITEETQFTGLPIEVSEVTATEVKISSTSVSKATPLPAEENANFDPKTPPSDETMPASTSFSSTKWSSENIDKDGGISTSTAGTSTATELESSSYGTGNNGDKHETETKSVVHDRVLTIQGFRTARIVVSSVFLVIGLTAMAALAVYVFRQKRRAVQYDQLTLLP